MKKEIGKKLKALRKRLGLTQKQFAGQIEGKVSYNYIGIIERGEQYPSVRLLEKIEKAFSIPSSYFFENNTILDTLNLLPVEIKNLVRNKKRQNLLRMSQELSKRDLNSVIQIIYFLSQREYIERLQASESECKNFSEEKKRDLINQIEKALASPSLKEDWLKESLKIALYTLKSSINR